MISRRLLLLSAAPLALSLAGCASGGAKLRGFVNAVYVDLNQVAQKIEQAVVIAKTDINAAAAFLQPWFQPTCQIVVTLANLGNQLIAAGAIKATDPNVQKAMQAANGLATDPIIVSVANNGALPANPVQTIIGIINAVSLIMALTSGRVTPTAAAAAA
jgi:hypothetical protein